MDKAIQNCFDICPSSKCLGTGAVQSRADFNIRTEEVLFMLDSTVQVYIKYYRLINFNLWPQIKAFIAFIGKAFKDKQLLAYP